MRSSAKKTKVMWRIDKSSEEDSYVKIHKAVQELDSPDHRANKNVTMMLDESDLEEVMTLAVNYVINKDHPQPADFQRPAVETLEQPCPEGERARPISERLVQLSAVKSIVDFVRTMLFRLGLVMLDDAEV